MASFCNAGQYGSAPLHAHHQSVKCEVQHAKDRLGCQDLAAHTGKTWAAGSCLVICLIKVHIRDRLSRLH